MLSSLASWSPRHRQQAGKLSKFMEGSSHDSQWFCTSAVHSGCEHGSRVGKVCLNRVGPHCLSLLAHSALLTLSGQRREGFHSPPFKLFVLTCPQQQEGGRSPKKALQWLKRGLSPLTEPEKDSDNHKHRDTHT